MHLRRRRLCPRPHARARTACAHSLPGVEVVTETGRGSLLPPIAPHAIGPPRRCACGAGEGAALRRTGRGVRLPVPTLVRLRLATWDRLWARRRVRARSRRGPNVRGHVMESASSSGFVGCPVLATAEREGISAGFGSGCGRSRPLREVVTTRRTRRTARLKVFRFHGPALAADGRTVLRRRRGARMRCCPSRCSIRAVWVVLAAITARIVVAIAVYAGSIDLVVSLLEVLLHTLGDRASPLCVVRTRRGVRILQSVVVERR
mmetsp:Transcript_26186/g.73257  ORF Transcript_26186/g.73257 Transcript_26186/m.73257 type:complete len:262 (+) Transcript_26186:694-1479(+)